MTDWYVWRDSLMYVTWLIHIYVTWLVDVCGMPKSDKRAVLMSHDTHEKCHKCDSLLQLFSALHVYIYTYVTHWCTSHDSFIYMTWLVDVCDMTQSNLTKEPYMCVMTHMKKKSHVKRAALMRHDTHENAYTIQIWLFFFVRNMHRRIE